MKKEREQRIRADKEFYAKCGELLGIDHEYKVPFSRKTRWNCRTLGNGRYPGFGTIQIFNPTCIRVMAAGGTKMFDNFEDVYEYIVALR